MYGGPEKNERKGFRLFTCFGEAIARVNSVFIREVIRMVVGFTVGHFEGVIKEGNGGVFQWWGELHVM